MDQSVTTLSARTNMTVADEIGPDQLIRLLDTIYTAKPLSGLLNQFGFRCSAQEIRHRLKQGISFGDWFSKQQASEIGAALLPAKPTHWEQPDFTFIDLFAGIGGIRRGFEAVGGRCVFTSEWDAYARRTYLANHYVAPKELDYFLNTDSEYSNRHQGMMNIQRITLSQEAGATEKMVANSIHTHIPDHDVLLAGFPCQPFSLAGVSKKNSLGRAHGFECQTQGTLFFDVEKIITTKKPKFFVLENVKNLKSHDSGKTFSIIIQTLHRLGYWIADISDEGNSITQAIAKVKNRKPDPVIIDAANFLPQHRERIVLVGIRNDIHHEGFSLTKILSDSQQKLSIKDLIEDKVDKKYQLSEKLWGYLFNYAIKHQRRGNGFGYGLIDPKNDNAVCRTLSARYYKDGSEILINHQGLSQTWLEDAKGDPENKFNPAFKTPRRLTPKECARLMGFEKPEKFRQPGDINFNIPVSDTRAYKQFGNSVVVPVFEAVASLLRPYLLQAKEQK